MKYRKNYKRRSVLPRKIIASGLSVAFCAGTVGGSYAGAMDDSNSNSSFSDNYSENNLNTSFKISEINQDIEKIEEVKRNLLDYAVSEEKLSKFRDMLKK